MIKLRDATKEDLEIVTYLGRTTFIETFAHLNNPENFQRYLNEQQNIDVIEKEFADFKNHFFIAEYNNIPAGFLKLVFDEDENQPELNGKKCLWLERIYILQKYQGFKMARLMLEKTLEIAEQNHFETVWLGVWEKNYKAIKIYENWGFELFGSHIFNLGGDLQTDLLMKKQIKS